MRIFIAITKRFINSASRFLIFCIFKIARIIINGNWKGNFLVFEEQTAGKKPGWLLTEVL